MNNREHFIEFVFDSVHYMDIPVYQRNYSWKTGNCEKLLKDLRTIHDRRDREYKHFFGSVIFVSNPNEHRAVIDGQQRITTVALLLAAIRDACRDGSLEYDDEELPFDIDERLKHRRKNTIFLTPIKKDLLPYQEIILGKEQTNPRNKTYENYQTLKKGILDMGMTADEIYAAIKDLYIVSILLDNGDDAQAVFESINSTGLNLSESDKIRNYLLMNLGSDEQNEYYEDYWRRIEDNVANPDDLPRFFRDYISIHTRTIPKFETVYESFKGYFDDAIHREGWDFRKEMDRIRKFSGHYRKMVTADLGDISRHASNSMFHIMYQNIMTTYPYLMALLDDHYEGNISKKDMESTLRIIENYLIRRSICGKPTNALSKVFLTLQFVTTEGRTDYSNYVEKLKFNLLNKTGSTSYPSDTEVIDSLKEMDIYRKKDLCALVLSAIENSTLNSEDTLKRVDTEGGLTIEHIMPQNETLEWREEIGDDYHEFHRQWVHKLGNLTLTSYNSDYSDRSYTFKRTSEKGFLESNLHLDKVMAREEKWTKDVILSRHDLMIEEFIKQMPELTTTIVGKKTEFIDVDLYDDNEMLLFKRVIGYTFRGEYYNALNAKSAIREIISMVSDADPDKILRESKDNSSRLFNYVSEEKKDDYFPIGHGLYFYLYGMVLYL